MGLHEQKRRTFRLIVELIPDQEDRRLSFSGHASISNDPGLFPSHSLDQNEALAPYLEWAPFLSLLSLSLSSHVLSAQSVVLLL